MRLNPFAISSKWALPTSAHGLVARDPVLIADMGSPCRGSTSTKCARNNSVAAARAARPKVQKALGPLKTTDEPQRFLSEDCQGSFHSSGG